MADIFQDEPIESGQREGWEDPQLPLDDVRLDSTPAAQQANSPQDYQIGDATRVEEIKKAKDRSQLLSALQSAKPRWMEEGGLSAPLARSPNPIPIPEWDTEIKETKTDFPTNTVETTQTSEDVATDSNTYSFKLSASSIDADAYTFDIHVGYGEINEEPPDGMTGDDDYFLTIPGADDGVEIWAVVTYDPDTLEITSRSLDFGAAVPDQELGSLFVPIGFVDVTYGDGGIIAKITPSNRQCGDIRVAFVYGNNNGAEAILPVQTYSDWVSLS